ncbi:MULTISPECIES: hypothetical protein [Bacillus]|uniref:hypothetical protein n=1 Tax=Bacillus TaxID=1386 RepID=UPI000BB996F5|nr:MULTISPECIES: hypothetical protein [Bacillus]
MFSWLFDIFLARTYDIFSSSNISRIEEVKNLLNRNSIKYKIGITKTDIRFAASVPPVQHIKVFRKDFQKAKEIIEGINRL